MPLSSFCFDITATLLRQSRLWKSRCSCNVHLVDSKGIEPSTSAMRTQRSPSWATSPYWQISLILLIEMTARMKILLANKWYYTIFFGIVKCDFLKIKNFSCQVGRDIVKYKSTAPLHEAAEPVSRNGCPRIMSGGEPSSIKRDVPCAARVPAPQLHAEDLFCFGGGNSMYQALYRKWRPKVFADVVGQSHITETLRRQVAEDRTDRKSVV